jgi:MFS family permease
MMMTDLSTPLNRASTIAPIMSAFAAGTALGPALGGYLVDNVGLESTFYLVGFSYIGVAALNRFILSETQSSSMQFPWQQTQNHSSSGDNNKNDTGDNTQSSSSALSTSIQDAVGQWVPLWQEKPVRRILIMNACYWVALSGSQMTLLPLILTDSNGFNLSATEVGQAYMGMSIIQIVGNPIFANVIDRVGKPPAIVAGCTLISMAMASIAYCHDTTQLAAALGLWSVGSSMLSAAPLAYISDKVQDNRRAQAIALLRTCGDVGFLLGASGTGALADWLGSSEVAVQSSAVWLLLATGWFARHQLLKPKAPTV